MGKPYFTFIDLFAGIGGIRLGFEKAGGECVFSSEIDKYAAQTYSYMFADKSMHDPVGDITKVNVTDIPAHDILCGGFPCPPFSIAGVSKFSSLGMKHGFDHPTKGSLFFEIARILKHHRPKAFFLENVKNIKTHNKGQTWEVIQKRLQDLGYSVSERILDAQLVLPQHRERIFIIGIRNDFGHSFQFPDINPVNMTMRDILETSVDDKYTISEKLWEYLQSYAEKHKKKGNGFGYGLVDLDGVSRTLSARYYKDGSEILVPQHGKRPRRLTPAECARLQGFPECFEKPVVSDCQAYKQFGNAVPVPIVANLAQALIKQLTQVGALTTDIVDISTRSQMMSKIKCRDTKPEMLIRKALFRRGFRYRLNGKKLTGKPDIVFPKYHAVIFVHGCFWHGHDCPSFKWPKSNAEFWQDKIDGNRVRDSKVKTTLQEQGWRIAIVWECAIKKNATWVIEKLESWLKNNNDHLEVN